MFEAIEGFQQPELSKGKLMFIVAAIGLAANLVSVLILRRDAAHNLNMRAPYLHLISNTHSSVAVIAGSLLILFYQIYWVNTHLTLSISLLIVKGSWSIIKETVNILMEAFPQNIVIEEIKAHVGEYPEIANIHLWRIADESTHLQFHVDIHKDLGL